MVGTENQPMGVRVAIDLFPCGVQRKTIDARIVSPARSIVEPDLILTMEAHITCFRDDLF